jgi:hypothetical protein
MSLFSGAIVHIAAIHPLPGQLQDDWGSGRHATISSRTPVTGYQDTVDCQWESHRPVAATIYGVAGLEGMGHDFADTTPVEPVVFGYIATGCDREDISGNHYGPEAQYAEDDKYHIHERSLSQSQQ